MPQPVTVQYVCCKYQGKDLGLWYRGEKTCFYDENNPAWCVFVGYEKILLSLLRWLYGCRSTKIGWNNMILISLLIYMIYIPIWYVITIWEICISVQYFIKYGGLLRLIYRCIWFCIMLFNAAIIFLSSYIMTYIDPLFIAYTVLNIILLFITWYLSYEDYKTIWTNQIIYEWNLASNRC